MGAKRGKNEIFGVELPTQNKMENKKAGKKIKKK
jgi:hypothetical protein